MRRTIDYDSEIACVRVVYRGGLISGVHLNVSVCMRACVRVFVYVCACVCVRVRVRVRVRARARVRVRMSVYARVRPLV